MRQETTTWETDIISINKKRYSVNVFDFAIHTGNPLGMLQNLFYAGALVFSSAASVRALTVDTLTAATEYAATNARMASFAGAGLAVPEGITSVIRNPSLFHAYSRENAYRLSGAVSYGRDSLFSQHMLDAGVAYFSGEPVSVGFLYRYLRAAENRDFSQFTLTFAGQMFEGDVEQGSVDIGLNFRYEITDWHSPVTDTLWTIFREYDSTSNWDYSITDTGSFSYTPIEQREVRRAALDVGFYQKKISEKLDFGVTFHNILGYQWDTWSPTVRNFSDALGADTLDVARDTLIDSIVASPVRDTFYYDTSQEENSGWLTGEEKRVSVGILYTTMILDGTAQLRIPLDLELPGIFSRTFFVSLRTGLELCFAEKYSLRFGYARAPRQVILNGELENANIFAGGGGLTFRPVTVDLYLRKKAWGLLVGIAL